MGLYQEDKRLLLALIKCYQFIITMARYIENWIIEAICMQYLYHCPSR
jgi:hypothetical protein